MKPKRHTEPQIVFALQQAEGGTAVAEICRKMGMGASPTGDDVVAVLDEAIRERDAPRSIQMDNGTEFTSLAMDRWAYWNGVTLDFSRPGKPQDNALIEAFRSRFRQGTETVAATIMHETAHWCVNKRGLPPTSDPEGFAEGYWLMSRCFSERFGNYFGGKRRKGE